MAHPPAALVWLLASGSFAVATLAIAGVARHAERHDRALQRRRLETLRDAFRRYARTGGDHRAVRRLAKAADATVFWSALEMLDLTPLEARRLSASLERVRHVRDESWTLRHDTPWRRELAARRMALIRARAGRRALRRAIQQGPEPVAFLAATGLARQRDAWTLRWILEHPAYFATRPSRARTALLRAFGPGATPLLAERLLAGVGHPALERSVIERLGAAGHTGSAAAIGVRLQSFELELRVAAARALGRLRSTGHVDALLAALEDEAWEVRAQAAHALGRIGASEAVPRLAAALSDPSWWVRRHSAYALSELGTEGTAALSGEARASNDRYARDIAHEALEVWQRRSA